MLSDKYVGTAKVAEELGVSISRVQALIKDGRLRAEKLGRDYVVALKDIEKVRVRKNGAPFGNKNKKEKRACRK